MTRADLPRVNDLYNHFVETSAVTFDLEPISLTRRQEWFETFAAESPYQAFVLHLDGQLVGFACSHPFRPKPAYRTSVETTIYLDPAVHGRGLGVPLYQRLFSALATEDLHRVYAVIALPNPASLALHRRLGFEQVGLLHQAGRKFDRYWDLCLMEKKLD